jgi:hypothetical protein
LSEQKPPPRVSPSYSPEGAPADTRQLKSGKFNEPWHFGVGAFHTMDGSALAIAVVKPVDRTGALALKGGNRNNRPYQLRVRFRRLD